MSLLGEFFQFPPRQAPARSRPEPGGAWRLLDAGLDAVGNAGAGQRGGLTFMPRNHRGGLLSALDPSHSARPGRSWTRLP